MPMSELIEWIDFYQTRESNRKQRDEVKKGNLLAMDDDQLAATFGKGK